MGIQEHRESGKDSFLEEGMRWSPKTEEEGRRARELELLLMGWDIHKAFHFLEELHRKERIQDRDCRGSKEGWCP